MEVLLYEKGRLEEVYVGVLCCDCLIVKGACVAFIV